MADETRIPLMSSDTFKSRLGKTVVGVIGTGNYAMALTKRLTITGYDVMLGSRRPEARRTSMRLSSDCVCGVRVVSIQECISACSLIFVAIHTEDFGVTLGKFTEETRSKILIDVSNREYRYAASSNAENLAALLPHALVVKGFNSVSAHTMEDLATSGGNHRVFLASNSPTARHQVEDLAKAMGFRVVDMGGIKSARYMEDFVLKTFSHWKIPIFLAFGIFNMWSLYIVYIYFIETTEFQWEQIFLKVLNKPLCMTAITMLALTYLPGHLASMLQLYHGTKHRSFPRPLDTWLKSRKQFGLVSLALATTHAIASALMMSPTYYSSWYHSSTVVLPANTSSWSAGMVLPVSKSWMVWKGEAACLVGILAFLLMVVMGLTSIPSVGESLNWSEWRCVHSKLSYFVLLFSVTHVVIMGAPGWVKVGPLKAVRSITFLSIILPVVVLALKLVFSCPPLSTYLGRIRRGWERIETESLSESGIEVSQPQSITGEMDKLIGLSNGGEIHISPKVSGKKACCCDDESMNRNSAVSCDGCKAGVFSVTVHCECSEV